MRHLASLTFALLAVASLASACSGEPRPQDFCEDYVEVLCDRGAECAEEGEDFDQAECIIRLAALLDCATLEDEEVCDGQPERFDPVQADECITGVASASCEELERDGRSGAAPACDRVCREP